MRRKSSSEAGIVIVHRNTEGVQNRGNFEVFEELFASDFVDHTPTGAATANSSLVLRLRGPMGLLLQPVQLLFHLSDRIIPFIPGWDEAVNH